jgi:hypothetical protein
LEIQSHISDLVRVDNGELELRVLRDAPLINELSNGFVELLVFAEVLH